MVIPKEAVQAAHAAICEQNLDECLDPDWRGQCVKAVEAAAPYIKAEALYKAAADAEGLGMGEIPVNALRHRADCYGIYRSKS